MRGMSEHQSR